MRVGHFARAASSTVVIAADTFDCSAAAYFSAATKIIMPGPAASTGAGAKISAPPSPRSSRPSFAASSFSFILMPSCSGLTFESLRIAAQHLDRVDQLRSLDLGQAVVMPKSASARETRAAFELAVDHACLRAER